MATLPSSFRTRRAMAILNIAAVGLALAGATSSVIAFPGASLKVAAPTLAIGTLWAWLLRRPNTVFKSKIRLGWVLSPVLAMMNASLAAGLVFGRGVDGVVDVVLGMFVGATFGALYWIPALLLTLFFFGLPIARAQRLAKQGLAGEERGERTVGIAAVALSLFAILLGVARLHAWAAVIAGVGGVIAGGAAAALATARGRRRKRFVADVEAGNVTGFRIESTQEGKVLLRVAAQKGYRVADFEEELYELDAEGEATRPARQELTADDTSQ